MKDTSIWAFVAGAVVAFFSSAFSRVVSEWGKRLCFGPKLLLSFESSEHAKGFVVKTIVFRTELAFPQTLANQGQTVQVTFDTCFVRVRVVNIKSRIASNCVPYLVGFKKKNDAGRFVDVGYCDSIPLRWSFSDDDAPHGIDIPCGVHCHFDVFSTDTEIPEMIPRLTTFPNSYRNLFGGKGTFMYEILVTADGITPERISLMVEWNGVWDDFRVSRHHA